MAPVNEGKRPYRMVARAASAAQTRQRILEAVLALASEQFLEDVSLAEVAAASGVTVQTILRHFEGRGALIAAAVARAEDALEGERRQVAAGDVDAVAARAVADYERYGETLLRWLAQEERLPVLRPIVERGRRLHHAWIDSVFELQLARRSGAARARLRAQLVAATDVYTWKLLRRDLNLSRRETVRAIAGLLRGALADGEGR